MLASIFLKFDIAIKVRNLKAKIIFCVSVQGKVILLRLDSG